MSISTEYDVIVVGGGPAGMMAAGRAAERGLRVHLLEKNNELGKKLSITGGGRCNITNGEFDTHELLSHYGCATQFLYSPFAQFNVKDTFDFFTKKNLPLTTEEKKRVFPESMKSTDVTKIMEKFVNSRNVTIRSGVSVLGIHVEDSLISGLETVFGVVKANAYIIAVGGKSHPETGSTGDGFEWLKKIGHTIHEPRPDLVPLIVKESWVHSLSGISLDHVRITFETGEQKIKKEGKILFTHFGLSGPMIFHSAREVKSMLRKGAVTARIDLFPKDDSKQLGVKLQAELEMHPHKLVSNMLGEWFPKAIVDVIVRTVRSDVLCMKAHMITRNIRDEIVERMKNISFTIIGTKGFEWAIVSDGGVDLSEINTKTMCSKKYSNLYIVGDMLHVNRESGGYSLQLCWTTGWVAGEHVCE